MTTMIPSVFADAVELPRALVAPAVFRPFEWAWLEESIPACFARRVAEQPHVTAVQTAIASLTYEQLGRRANQLAANLVHRLGRDAEPVAILAGSDLQAVVAMLGVLTAGKFFVAINPAATRAEIVAILADCAAKALVADSHGLALASSLPPVTQSGLELLQLDGLDADAPDSAPGVPVNGSAFAQIAYTSGSTGAPKGILKTHRALLHQSMTHINGYFITAADRLMAPAPLIFGASLGIVFSALLGGATLLPIRLRDYNAAQLQAWLRDERVTVYHSVASFFRQFAATLEPVEAFPSLRVIKLGGETIQPVDIQLFQQRFSDQCVLRIGLASTEAGNYCWHFVGKETAVQGPTVPVGRPLIGTVILLLDEDRTLVAPDEVGEIAVRSAYLATGYWRNPELTQARFLPDPVDAAKSIYLTGDLGRWRDDGLLEHLGRADQMVKIRGNRVELSAVEAALLALPAVKEAVVVAAAGAGGGKRLLAHLTPVAEELSTSQLRLQLRSTLPEFMLPARMVWIDRMPLLPSGKIDRAALPAVGTARPDLDTPFVTPRGDLEQQLADLWAELLELDEVGVDDNFFELGGDSILAMRMAIAVEQWLGRQTPPEFFRRATVRSLSSFLQPDPATGAVESALMPPQSQRQSAPTPSPALRRPFWRRVTVHALLRRLRRLTEHTIFTQAHDQAWRRLAQWCALAPNTGLYAPELGLLNRMQQAMNSQTSITPAQRQAYIMGNLLMQQWWRLPRTGAASGSIEVLQYSTQPFWAEMGRLLQQGAADELAGQFTFAGWETLKDAYQQGHGVILVSYHSPGLPFAMRATSRRVGGEPILTAAQVGGLQASRGGAARANAIAGEVTAVTSERTVRAYQQLRRGGIVHFANDHGYTTDGTMGCQVAGKQYAFKPTFAEMAQATGAAIVPTLAFCTPSGQIHAVFLTPFSLPATDSDPVCFSRSALDQYASFLDRSWRAYPESLLWSVIATHLQQPVSTPDGRMPS